MTRELYTSLKDPTRSSEVGFVVDLCNSTVNAPATFINATLTSGARLVA